MIMETRRKVAAVVAALAIGVGGAVWATSAASAAPAAPARPAASVPECRSGQLAVWVSPDRANGAAGSIFYPLDLTNISGRACFLVGWPGVSATSLNGTQLGSPAQRDTSVARRVVTLAPGASAHATLRYIDVQVDPGPGCRQVNSTFLRVFPPDQTNSRNAFFQVPACKVKGRIYLRITRIAPGV